jgi:uroporphyrinogen decarboxylase
MSKTMTSHERIRRMYEHREADRIPVFDEPWAATIERWQAEGMPRHADYVDFFGLDRLVGIGVDNSPRYPVRVLEENDRWKVHTTAWGVTARDWKHAGGTPEFLDFTIVDRDSWRKAKERMTPSRDRVDWARLEKNYRRWREQGAWIHAQLWFGFDVTHSWIMGTERVLMAMAEDPEWIVEIFNHELDVSLALFDQVWEAGYTFDAVKWWDDMGYKHNQFFSLSMYRELLKPVHRRAIEWAHAKGIKALLHSCGDIRPFVPELIEIGLDGLNPLEVKAGMDPLDLKRRYGDRLLLYGGINAVLWDDFDALATEMRRLVPELKRNGGYIFSSDHSVPNSVSLETFRRTVELAKQLGSYPG